MTEREWLACTDPTRLLAHLGRPPDDRKLRLYGVACCRAHAHLLCSTASHEAIDWAERFADGDAERDDAFGRLDWTSEGAAFGQEEASREDDLADWEETTPIGQLRGLSGARYRRGVAAAYFAHSLLSPSLGSCGDPSLRRFADVLRLPELRDVFGNPFRPAALDPAWRTPPAVGLAAALYGSRDFAALPVLADMLEEAGCGDADLLAHCRGPGPHVRGCWVVDLVLGRA